MSHARFDHDADAYVQDSDPNIDWSGHNDSTPYRKVYVDGVPVSVVRERVEYLDADGKRVTESLRDFTRKTIRRQFGSLDVFLSHWNGEARKQALIDRLVDEGVVLAALTEDVGEDLDLPDGSGRFL